MDKYIFKFIKGTHKAIVSKQAQRGDYKVNSVSYPMLVKTISKAGPTSPNGNGTNILTLTKGTDGPVVVELTECFPSLSELQIIVNQAIVDAYPSETDVVLLKQTGLHKLQWTNSSASDWTINYMNVGTKQLITGISDDFLQILVVAGESSASFYPDPSLGASSITLSLLGSFNLILPVTGSYLDNVLFFYPNEVDVTVPSTTEAGLSTTFASLSVERKLYSLNTSNIQINIS